MKFLAFLLFLSFQIEVWAGDRGFRLVNGECRNQAGQLGYNDYFIGPCSDFRGSVIQRFRFDGADLSGSNFKGTNLENSTFNNCKLDFVDFSESQLTGTEFAEAEIKNSNFSKSNLKNAKFSEAVIENVNFNESDLTANNLSFLMAKGSSFNGAKMSAVNLEHSSLEKSQFKQTQLKGANLSQTNLRQANFEDAVLEEALLTAVRAEGADFSRSRVTTANLNNSNLSQSTWKNSSLAFSQFKGANLTDADLSEANLRSVDFGTSNIEKAKLTGAVFNSKTKMKLSQEEALKLGMIYKKLLEFSGVSSQLPVEELEGWSLCHKSDLNSGGQSIEGIKAACRAKWIMLACKKKTSNFLEVAAYGNPDKVFFSKDGDEGTIDNGVKFYYSPEVSWGFAPATALIRRSYCDKERTVADKRLCFETFNGNLYQQNNSCGYNDRPSNEYERLIFKSED